MRPAASPESFEYYLTRALEEAYKVGQKPVEADMIENVLAKDINGLEPRLTRQGYNAKVLAELLNAKPREIKSFLSGQLASGRPKNCRVNYWRREFRFSPFSFCVLTAATREPSVSDCLLADRFRMTDWCSLTPLMTSTLLRPFSPSCTCCHRTRPLVTVNGV